MYMGNFDGPYGESDAERDDRRSQEARDALVTLSERHRAKVSEDRRRSRRKELANAALLAIKGENYYAAEVLISALAGLDT